MKTYHDIEGDGGSNVLAQVQAQRAAITASLAGVRHVLAVGSGKGGVGKSTLTMALAQALRARGQELTILDADFNGPSQARLAGLEGAPWVPGEGGLLLPRRPDGIGVASMGSVFADSEAVSFDSVSKGDEFTWRATREFAVLGQLLAGVAWGELDFLLLDLPPGAERTLQYAEFLGEGAAFLLVTIPSDLSRGVVARSISALEGSPAKLLGYVENMAGYLCPGCETVQPLFPAAGVELSIPCLGSVPFDPRIAALCDRGWPREDAEALDGASSEAVQQIAGQLVRTLEAEA